MSEHKKHRGGNNSSNKNNGFKGLGLSNDVYQGIIVRMGFQMPTPVQRKAIPVILSSVETTVVMARTGSGKTLAFLIPLYEKLLSTIQQQQQQSSSTTASGMQAVILSPTRELSQQTLRVWNKFVDVHHNNANNNSLLRAVGIHGGESMEKQFELLASSPAVIIATPGRLAHHITEISDFALDTVQMCILDEADRLLEMGFASQLRQIVNSIHHGHGSGHNQTTTMCQKVLLSATMPKVLVEFTKSGLCCSTDPTMVRLDQEVTVSSELRMAFVTCRSTDKDAALLHILQQHILLTDDDNDKKKSNKGATIIKNKSASASSTTGRTLIFAATRHHVEYITTLLKMSCLCTNASMIYGTMDQEARKHNLKQFTSGQTSVLVVTDVAARGIDIPLMDHVIHYHFPSHPKLFIHRSGRVARAGRIGYCWGLIEPDELPYMMDLHVFLGRKPMTCPDSTYTLFEMTPDMVHYGSLPESIATTEVENVNRILNSELSGSLEAESLRALTKVCRNAMKQYRRTRTEASKDAVRRAKAVLEGERTETGQRLGQGAIPPHPLLRAMEIQTHRSRQDENTKQGRLGDLDNLRKRQDFLDQMSQFRPKETVFEAFATGKGKDVGIVSHLDRGRTTSNRNKNESSSLALSAMKDMRRQMRIARDKGSTLVVAGSSGTSSNDNNEGAEMDADEPMPLVGSAAEPLTKSDVAQAESMKPIVTKPRMSKAERRRLKKNPQASARQEKGPQKEKSKEVKRDFRDPAYFIENDFTSNSEEAVRSRRIEEAMQPSSSSTAKGSMGTALRLEEAMLDIVGDENDELVKKQRMMRWDKSKRKYVQTTVGDELAGESKSKKLRLESGQLVKNNKLKLGELYQKWQKKTNRSIGRTGVFDEDGGGGEMLGGKNMAKKQQREKKKSSASKKSKDEFRSSVEIQKERQKKHDMKIKNMKKGDRRHHEHKQRADRNAIASSGKTKKR